VVAELVAQADPLGGYLVQEAQGLGALMVAIEPVAPIRKLDDD
jgi:hypothetical protein